MKTCAVVIPIYKDYLSESEQWSLAQCAKILVSYDLIFVAPSGVTMMAYESCLLGRSYSIEVFDPEYFQGVEGYNRLMMTKEFYRRFQNRFEYILIYQLDCFVFRDVLEEWCRKGYDYIGAPWFKNFDVHREVGDLWRCGNGGLSLRRMSFCLKALSWPFPFRWNVKLIAKRFYLSLIKAFLKGRGNVLLFEVDSSIEGNQEDVFFSYYTLNTPIAPRLPSPEEAMKFAFEKSPSYLYELNKKKLPFGCHAFMKWEYEEFWKQYIPVKNVDNLIMR